MKPMFYVLSVAIFSLSFNVFSAIEIKKPNSEKMREIKHVSISGMPTPESVIKAIQLEAKKAGGDYFSISRLSILGNGSKWSANACLYKEVKKTSLNPKVAS